MGKIFKNVLRKKLICMDRFFRGFTAGVVGGVLMQIWNFFSFHDSNFTKLCFMDYCIWRAGRNNTGSHFCVLEKNFIGNTHLTDIVQQGPAPHVG